MLKIKDAPLAIFKVKGSHLQKFDYAEEKVKMIYKC